MRREAQRPTQNAGPTQTKRRSTGGDAHEGSLRLLEDEGAQEPVPEIPQAAVTLRLDQDTVAYFKAMAEETGIPYPTLINLYLRDCALHKRELYMRWAS
jgi:uncharacterized protein (DUF4415 family)